MGLNIPPGPARWMGRGGQGAARGGDGRVMGG